MIAAILPTKQKTTQPPAIGEAMAKSLAHLPPAVRAAVERKLLQQDARFVIGSNDIQNYRAEA